MAKESLYKPELPAHEHNKMPFGCTTELPTTSEHSRTNGTTGQQALVRTEYNRGGGDSWLGRAELGPELEENMYIKSTHARSQSGIREDDGEFERHE